MFPTLLNKVHYFICCAYIYARIASTYSPFFICLSSDNKRLKICLVPNVIQFVIPPNSIQWNWFRLGILTSWRGTSTLEEPDISVIMFLGENKVIIDEWNNEIFSNIILIPYSNMFFNGTIANIHDSRCYHRYLSCLEIHLHHMVYLTMKKNCALFSGFVGRMIFHLLTNLLADRVVDGGN